jgi:hypothetical protein
VFEKALRGRIVVYRQEQGCALRACRALLEIGSISTLADQRDSTAALLDHTPDRAGQLHVELELRAAARARCTRTREEVPDIDRNGAIQRHRCSRTAIERERAHHLPSPNRYTPR